MGNFGCKKKVEVVDWSYSGFYFKTGLPVFIDHSIRNEFFNPGSPISIRIYRGIAKVTYPKNTLYFNYRVKDGMYWIGCS